MAVFTVAAEPVCWYKRLWRAASRHTGLFSRMITSIRTLTVLLTAVVMTRAQVPSFGWCPDYLPKASFEMPKFMGTWYEAERYLNVMEAGSRCVRTEYSLAKDDRILVANEIQNRFTGVKRVLNGEIRTIVKGAESKLNVKYSTLPYPVETSYTILDTDYDDYAVVWSCSGLGIFNTQNAWVMTRERNPTVTTLQKAYAVLDKHKISRTFFVKTDQTECMIAEPADENDVNKEESEGERSAVAEEGDHSGTEHSEGDVPAKPMDKEVDADAVRKETVPEVDIKPVEPVSEMDSAKKTVEVPAAKSQ